MQSEVVLFWFRRDLRIEDNVGLLHALSLGVPVLPLFIFDVNILNRLESKYDRRVDYIQQSLCQLNNELAALGSGLNTYYGDPLTIFKKISIEYSVQALYCNQDYEPEAIQRDAAIFDFFQQLNIPFRTFKDQVIFEGNDIVKTDGSPYTVYTPYAKKWKQYLTASHYQTIKADYNNFYKQPCSPVLSLPDIGFKETDIVFKKPELDIGLIKDYHKHRDYPALDRTSKLGIALRFGTISIRRTLAFAVKHNQTWLSELIWREFFMQILFHFPQVVHQSFKRQYDLIQWRNHEAEFGIWCRGETGYPLVDAGMRQLNETGFMHNRVRMVTASFLCKHLLIDWRWGEAYFAQKLNDYDLSANNGNWQWAAGSGCDAAPYFRVFNPSIQSEKFDKDRAYIRQWVPEMGTDSYPNPIVEHAFARARALEVYGNALKSAQYG